MSISQRLRRLPAAAFAIVAAAGICVVAAPAAQAATTTTCTSAFTLTASYAPPIPAGFVAEQAVCGAFVDAGGPYTVKIGTLVVTNGLGPSLQNYFFYRVLATCGVVTPAAGAPVLDASQCTYSNY